MSNKVRVYNRNKFDVGVCTMNGIGINIKSGSFTVLDQNEIDYIGTLCNYFIDGTLIIEDGTTAKENLVVPEENKHYFASDEEIKKKLKGTAKAIENWLKDEENRVYLERVNDIAKTMDLPKSKLDIINAKVSDDDEA